MDLRQEIIEMSKGREKMLKNLQVIVLTILVGLVLNACSEKENEPVVGGDDEKNEANNETRESKINKSKDLYENVIIEDVYQFMDIILEYEGGYSNHENDIGGKTNFGITETVWLENRHLINSNKSISEVKEEDAREFYAHYWNSTAIPFSKMTPSLSLVMLDTTVLMWEGSEHTGGSALFFQQAVNNLGIFDEIIKELSDQEKESCNLTEIDLRNEKLPEDGGWGKQSQCVFEHLLLEEQKKIAIEVLNLREEFHIKTSDKEEGQKDFKEG